MEGEGWRQRQPPELWVCFAASPGRLRGEGRAARQAVNRSSRSSPDPRAGGRLPSAEAAQGISPKPWRKRVRIKSRNWQAPSPDSRASCALSRLSGACSCLVRSRGVCLLWACEQVPSSLTGARGSRSVNRSLVELPCVHGDLHGEQIGNSGSEATVWGEITPGPSGFVLKGGSIDAFRGCQNSSGWRVSDGR